MEAWIEHRQAWACMKVWFMCSDVIWWLPDLMNIWQVSLCTAACVAPKHMRRACLTKTNIHISVDSSHVIRWLRRLPKQYHRNKCSNRPFCLTVSKMDMTLNDHVQVQYRYILTATGTVMFTYTHLHLRILKPDTDLDKRWRLYWTHKLYISVHWRLYTRVGSQFMEPSACQSVFSPWHGGRGPAHCRNLYSWNSHCSFLLYSVTSGWVVLLKQSQCACTHPKSSFVYQFENED